MTSCQQLACGLDYMHQHRVLAWLKAIFAKHGNMAKLAGWRSWRIFVDRAREAEMVARHELRTRCVAQSELDRREGGLPHGSW